MTMRVHHPDTLEWRRMGDIEMGGMRDHIDATELAGDLAFHEAGTGTGMQLMELRLQPHTLIAPHSHDDDEIYFVAEGRLSWGDKSLPAGGSIFIPAGMTYSFRTGETPTRLLNFRARADHSFHPGRRDGDRATAPDA